jgi:hypothetical protein
MHDIEWAYCLVHYWVLLAYALAVFTVRNIPAVYYWVRDAVRDTAGGSVIELESEVDSAEVSTHDARKGQIMIKRILLALLAASAICQGPYATRKMLT